MDDRLSAAVNSVESEYMSSFEELKDYYQDEYSQKEWIRAMVGDMYGLSPADHKQYRAARRKIEKWAKGDSKPGKQAQKDLAALGRKLPPKGKKISGNGLTIKIKGNIKVSKKTRYRQIDVFLDYDEALDFLDNPSFQQLFESYGVDGDMFTEGLQPDVSVEISDSQY